MPLVVAMAISASAASARLLALVGPRPLIPTGLVLSAMGLVLFTRLPLQPDYVGHVMPGLLILGLGIGLIFAPAVASATWGYKSQRPVPPRRRLTPPKILVARWVRPYLIH